MVKTKTSLHHLTIACLYIDRKRQHPIMDIALLYDIKRILSLVKWLIFKFSKNILIGRTNDTTAFEIEFFNTMGSPTYDTCHGENRGIDFLWQTNHFIDKATVEIKICTRRLAASAMFLQTFDTFLLYQLQEIILIFSTLSLASSPARRFNSTARGSLNV